MALVDRYGRPSTADSQISPYRDRRNQNYATQQRQSAPPLQSPTNPTGNTGVSGYSNQPGGIPPPSVQRTSTPPGGEVTRQNVMDTIKRYGAPTPENLRRAVAENPWLGSVTGGKGDKLALPNGETWDVIHDTGLANAGWQTLTGHTAAARAAAAAAGGGGGTINSAALQQSINGVGNLPTYTPFQFSNPTLQAYQPGQVTQFQVPDQSQATTGQNQLIQQLLANPESMSPDVVNAMRAQQREAALQGQQDMMQQLQQSAVSRGALGGNLDANARRLQALTMSQMLGSDRDINIAAAQQNFNDRLNALGATDSVLNNQLSRATQGFGATLQGQMSQESLNQAAIQSALQNAQFGLQREGMQAGENQFGFNSQADAVKFALQKALAAHGISFDNAQLAQQARQFNSQMGFNYDQLAANQQADLIRQVLGF